MKQIRKSGERGYTHIDWLKSYHSFSFGHYYNPRHTGFNELVVINDDIINGGGGFGEHGHKDMEIVTYVIDGELAHRDSMGNVATIKAGEVQRMSAGTGVKHSEFNASKDKACRLLQVWFLPANEGDKPSYEQKLFTRDDKKNKLKLVVSPDARENSVGIHQDVEIYASVLEKDKILKQSIESRNVWVQLAVGNLEVNGEKLKEGDGISFENEKELNIKALSDESEFVIFSLGK